MSLPFHRRPFALSAFTEQLWDLPPGVNPSLLHGTVCGMLCGAPAQAIYAYRRALIDLLDEAAEVDDDELARFIEYAADDLAAPDLGFAPLLPDDDQAITDRVDALAQWSAGFVAGFEEVGGDLDEEAADALEDIARIADVGADVDDDEFDYFSVAEHLKVAVLTVHDATRDGDAAYGDDEDDDEYG
jgi:uncharacterized protein YgfB (UPF0149 family)